MMRNLALQLLGILFLIIPTAHSAAADVFTARAEVGRINAFQHVTGIR